MGFRCDLASGQIPGTAYVGAPRLILNGVAAPENDPIPLLGACLATQFYELFLVPRFAGVARTHPDRILTPDFFQAYPGARCDLLGEQAHYWFRKGGTPHFLWFGLTANRPATRPFTSLPDTAESAVEQLRQTVLADSA